MLIKLSKSSQIQFIECSDCRYFSFFENEIEKGKCSRDSIYEFTIVNPRDRKCRPCSTCNHLIEEDGIYGCFWRTKIGSYFDTTITPECPHHQSK